MIEVIRPFFRTRMKTLGYRENTSTFFDAQSLEGKLDLQWHLEVRSPRVTNDTNCIRFETPAVLRLTYEGGKNSQANAIERAERECSRLICDLAAAARSNGQGLSGLYMASVDISPLNASNQDASVMALTFTALTFLAPQ